MTTDTQTLEKPKRTDGFPEDVDSQAYWRQLDILSPQKIAQVPIVVVGAGAIGSAVVRNLAKMGARRITVYDHDRVSDWNTSNQIFPRRFVGDLKVEALAKIIEYLAEVTINAQPQKVGDGEGEVVPELEKGTILITAVDKMAPREFLWELAKDNPKVKLFIDPRMGAEVLRMYAISPLDPQWQKFYQDNLYKSEDAVEAKCTERAIIYTPEAAGFVVASVIKNMLTAGGKSGKTWPKEIILNCADFMLMVERDLPEPS